MEQLRTYRQMRRNAHKESKSNRSYAAYRKNRRTLKLLSAGCGFRRLEIEQALEILL
jgi:hypothetical protein